MLLSLRDARVHYKKVAALKGVSLEVPEGGIVTITTSDGARHRAAHRAAAAPAVVIVQKRSSRSAHRRAHRAALIGCIRG